MSKCRQLLLNNNKIILKKIKETPYQLVVTPHSLVTPVPGNPLMCFLACVLFFFLKILFIYFQREGKGGRGREPSMGKRNTSISCFLHLARNPGMCPDLESYWQPFAWQDDAQPTEPHQSAYLMDLPIPDISHKWSHTLCGLLCLASFT